LQNKCFNLEGFLKHDIDYDLDGLDLFLELKVLKEILQIEESTPIDILNYIKRLDSFPNACIAYKILLTIHDTVASAERSFSKLKLIKSYLRLGLAKQVTRHNPFTTRLTSDPFSLNPDATRLTKRVGAPDTTRPTKFHGSPDTTCEPV
jgi:hypothetical protein